MSKQPDSPAAGQPESHRLHTVCMKFGGTSVGSADAISQVIEIVRRAKETQAERVIAVVSALSGVTDLLQKGLLCAARGDADCYREVVHTLRERHAQVSASLLPDNQTELVAEIDQLIDAYLRFCDGVHVLGETTPRALAYTTGLGERMSVRLVTAALNKNGIKAQAVDATDLIVTDNQYLDAAPHMEATQNNVRRVLSPLLDDGVVPVVTGFIGATPEGVSTVLGRGGSDYSAALIGPPLGSDEVWIWTDVDGVMSADPRVVPDARSIEVLTYLEMSELAYFGAKVLHPKTVRPVLEAGIPLRVKNTFNPDHPGTLIVPNHWKSENPIKAVTAIKDVGLITIAGKGMLGVTGIAARTFGAVAGSRANVLIISQASSEQSICFAVPQNDAPLVVDALKREFEAEIARRDIDEVFTRDDVTIITVVGGGLRDTPGVAGQIFSATGDNNVNVLAIVQGSSECSLSIVVASEEANEALQAIHPLTLDRPG
jgi:aspartokinase/homoserine dehydrogenase 1